MDEQIVQMYNDDDAEINDQSASFLSNQIRANGKITELIIDGKKVAVIDPSVVVSAENMIKSMQARISVLEQEIRRLNARLSRVDRAIISTIDELDKKVSYE
jgi:hypothetical protein